MHLHRQKASHVSGSFESGNEIRAARSSVALGEDGACKPGGLRKIPN
jgi:hypothetical protein